MKAIFGILSLVVVLAIVASLAKKQLQAFGGPSSVVTRQADAARRAAAVSADGGDRSGATVSVPGGVAGAMAADPNAISVPQVSRNMQEQARDRAVQAMQQGMERNERAEPR